MDNKCIANIFANCANDNYINNYEIIWYNRPKDKLGMRQQSNQSNKSTQSNTDIDSNNNIHVKLSDTPVDIYLCDNHYKIIVKCNNGLPNIYGYDEQSAIDNLIECCRNKDMTKDITKDITKNITKNITKDITKDKNKIKIKY